MLWIQILPDNGDRRVQQETGPFGRKGKSTYETVKFLCVLEGRMGFKIRTIQVDNGTEFVNDHELFFVKHFSPFSSFHIPIVIMGNSSLSAGLVRIQIPQLRPAA